MAIIRARIRTGLPLIFVAALVGAPGCGHSPSEPTPVVTPAPSPADQPTARMSVTVDALGSHDAVAFLSDVSVDASSSSGTGPLTVTTDFGDGTTASGAITRHVYQSAGAFTITCAVKDGQGRSSTTTTRIDAKTVAGTWFAASYVPAHRRVEVRRLTIAAQDGLTVRGTYAVTGDANRPFEATLSQPRTIRITAGAASFSGSIPGQFGTEADRWMLEASGEGGDGQRLEFRPVSGDPASVPPDAVLRLRFNSFGDQVPIIGVSPVRFDGTTSRGSGPLQYILEFGDGQSSTEPLAVHVLDGSSDLQALTARLTVIDGLGRTDSESEQFWAMPLDGRTFSTSGLALSFFDRRSGTYSCRAYFDYERSAPCTARFEGERQLRVSVPSEGIEFRGELLMATLCSTEMRLTQYGGPLDGRNYRLVIPYLCY